MTDIVLTMVPVNASIADLVNLCAQNKLPFSGENSLCSKVAAMGYKTTSLYEAVIAAEHAMKADE